VTRSFRLLLPTLLCLLLGACEGAPPPHFDRLSYDYLNKFRLNVASVTIDDSWVASSPGQHVESLSPEPPLQALRQMLQDRLIAAGNTGRAVATIEDASIVERDNQYVGALAVRLNLQGDDGSPIGSVEARVVGTHAVTDTDTQDVQLDLYALTKQLMDSMNVELEYQIDRSLTGSLQPTTPIAPAPPPVQTQDLSAPSD
jgi:hypothetical protein